MEGNGRNFNMKSAASSLASDAWPEQTRLDHMLQVAAARSNVLHRTIVKFGNMPVSDYLQSLQQGVSRPYQARDDLSTAVYHYAAPLLGSSVAMRAADEIANAPVALTANHHGVDYFAQSAQGTLLLALLKGKNRHDSGIVPVFSCGNIPMNNLTYPHGMLFYQLRGNLQESSPRRMPVFPDRYKRKTVSTVGSFDRHMIDRAFKHIEKMGKNLDISARLEACAREILLQDYCDPRVIRLSSYSQQSVILNHKLWKRLLSASDPAPEIVYLEIEQLVRQLLKLDLKNPESLAWRLMFDPELREQVLRELDGHRVCWHMADLTRRLEGTGCEGRSQISSHACGTVFFWGIDDENRKVPLTLYGGPGGTKTLQGLDDSGNVWEIQFTPAALIDALEANRILPSLFTCYMTVALARGVICLGGYYQAEYLPAIQQGVLSALKAVPRYREMMDPIRSVPTDRYLSGMQTVMTETRNGHLLPAGPLEIIAGGGLDREDLGRIGKLTVQEAHIASLWETLPDITGDQFCKSGWKTSLARDCHQLLADRVVVK